MLPTPEQVKDYIAGGLACQHLEVEGDGQHFFATIVSDAFQGKRLIARHQMVYAALGDRMRAEIHALSMKTLTPEEWKPSMRCHSITCTAAGTSARIFKTTATPMSAPQQRSSGRRTAKHGQTGHCRGREALGRNRRIGCEERGAADSLREPAHG